MVTIRIAGERDAAAIAEIYRPFCESTAVSFEFIAPTADEMAKRIESITSQYPWLVLDDAGLIAGYAYASRHRERAAYGWSVDTAVYIDSRCRRSGVGRALYTTLFAILRLQGYFNAYAGIALPNASSTGLHEAMGFRLVGVYERVGYKHGAWHDVAWYQLALQPERINPDPPIAMAALTNSPAWAQAIAQGIANYRRHATNQ
jgi:L-amino acid N-acyltransferase YncA